jgi:hypothetical protein
MGGPKNRGYVTVVGVQEETVVTVTPTFDIEASIGIEGAEAIEAIPAGTPTDFTIGPFDVVNLETRLLTEANQLGVGPMGFGGTTTLLEVFIDCLHRLPASYFVSVSYMCWACRRQTIRCTPGGELLAWL